MRKIINKYSHQHSRLVVVNWARAWISKNCRVSIGPDSGVESQAQKKKKKKKKKKGYYTVHMLLNSIFLTVRILQSVTGAVIVVGKSSFSFLVGYKISKIYCDVLISGLDRAQTG